MRLSIMASPLAIISSVSPAVAQETADEPLTVAEARASLTGSWRGELQYRDYQADAWFGIPVSVEAEIVEDGVTLIRRASFDDGPARGLVYITTVAMLATDGATEYVGSYRADRPAEHGSFTLRLIPNADGASQSRTHWTMVAETDGNDDNRPARIRETTVRIDDSVTTTKTVDFMDDDEEVWLQRNRTVLARVDE